MLVWNQYSDTIYRVSEKGEEPVAMWGKWNPLFFPYNYFVIDGREYLEAIYQPYELVDAWLASDDPKIREQAKSIDEEGNNVLIRIRLKK